ncbi:hypothetical protein GSI_06858 [Ganoderma sinense ZZ0214-1]|uniref:Uncharacterized protein n=1 Tax=Ganoderma sinense ZZ0214-1 TaxID=1077348 RepID=A0A2G8SEF1_9APHY|nr:hypothetical protein GSI_06858 [Ganoderma sinense ZZ0214-1]
MSGGDLPVRATSEDLALLSLIASYSLQDVDEIGGRRRGKAIDGALSDEEIAFQLFAEEARALQTLVGDAIFARSLDQALQTDTALLEEHERIEKVEREDREAVRALTERCGPTTWPKGSSLSKKSSTSTLASFTTATSSTIVSPTTNGNNPEASLAPSSSSKQLPGMSRARHALSVETTSAVLSFAHLAGTPTTSDVSWTYFVPPPSTNPSFHPPVAVSPSTSQRSDNF